jgi:hypothetical protein
VSWHFLVRVGARSRSWMQNGLPSWSGEQFFPPKSFCGNLDQELAADCGRMTGKRECAGIVQ